MQKIIDEINETMAIMQKAEGGSTLAWAKRKIALLEHGEDSAEFEEANAVWRQGNNNYWTVRLDGKKKIAQRLLEIGLDPEALKDVL